MCCYGQFVLGLTKQYVSVLFWTVTNKHSVALLVWFPLQRELLNPLAVLPSAPAPQAAPHCWTSRRHPQRQHPLGCQALQVPQWHLPGWQVLGFPVNRIALLSLTCVATSPLAYFTLRKKTQEGISATSRKKKKGKKHTFRARFLQHNSERHS